MILLQSCLLRCVKTLHHNACPACELAKSPFFFNATSDTKSRITVKLSLIPAEKVAKRGREETRKKVPGAMKAE